MNEDKDIPQDSKKTTSISREIVSFLDEANSSTTRKYLQISEQMTKSKDNDKGSRSKITKACRNEVYYNKVQDKDPRLQEIKDKEF
ncbi:hypothetical protein Tco_0596434 [Tanacetum coccineum]